MDWSEVHIVALFSMMGLATVVGDPTKVGPFYVKITAATDISPKLAKSIIFEPKLKKYNRTMFIVNSPLNVTRELDDSLVLLVDMAVQTSNGWKEHSIKQSFMKACSSIVSYAGDIFFAIEKNAGMKTGCPLSKGYYTLKDLPLAVEIKQIPVFWYGKYKVQILVFEKGRDPYTQSILGLEALVDIVPRSKH